MPELQAEDLPEDCLKTFPETTTSAKSKRITR